MNRGPSAHVVGAALITLAMAGCHNTAQGVKADTQRAIEKIDRKLDKEGHKMEGDKGDQHTKKDDH